MKVLKACLVGLGAALGVAAFMAVLAILPYLLIGGVVTLVAYAAMTEEEQKLPPPDMRTIEHEDLKRLGK